MEKKVCQFCGEEITGKRGDALFCSSTCKAKHWENKKNREQTKVKQEVKKDVTAQLRGVLNGSEAPEKTNQKVELVKMQVPTYYEDRERIEKEIRRLTDVKNELTGRIEKLTDEFERIKAQEGNLWIWGLTGTGAIIGNVSSEQKTKGTILGGAIGLVSGVLFKRLTLNFREREKAGQVKKLIEQIEALNLELPEVNRLIEIQKEQIRKMPLLGRKEILILVRVNTAKQEGKDTVTLPVSDMPQLAPGLDKDVCFVPHTNRKIINSRELENMDFKALDFRGKWQIFFGNPSVNFNCIIHGMPGEGKSTFAIQFAKYLAENIGRVVYISGEEGITKTLRDKFINNDSCSAYLDIADLRSFEEIKMNVPAETYNFVFIDSLDNMHIDADTMKLIRELYKNSSLITISQSTKDGKIRGSNELVHDCDISVKVENGIARTNKNRFKEKGMAYDVFDTPPPPPPFKLMGF